MARVGIAVSAREWLRQLSGRNTALRSLQAVNEKYEDSAKSK
jgi:hypothetical protein